MKKNIIEEQSINDNNYQKLKELFPHAVSIDEEGKYIIDKEKLQMSLDPSKAEIKEDGYGLNWVGKKEAYHTAFTKNYKVLKPLKDDSKNWDETENILIKGDNLDALKILRHNYFESIKMIYIDPPYNTKSDEFVYNDNFTSSTEQTLEELGYDKEYIDYIENIQGAKTHSGWLSFMYSRLLLAKDLLKEDGAIFISIDDNEFSQLKILCDEIFGETNFMGNIVRATGQTTGQDSGGLGSSFDFILLYTKNDNYDLSGLPLTEKDLKRFENQDEKGHFAYDQMRKTGSNDKREDRPNMYYAIQDPDNNELYPIAPAGYESCWRFEKKTYEKLMKENFIIWKKSKRGNTEIWWPYVKYYLEGRTKRPSPLWNDLEGNKKAARDLRILFNGNKVFDFPKPIEMLKRCIQIVPNAQDDDLILDFFAGSGTTAHAVMDLNAEDGGNRKYICVQWAEETSQTSEAKKAGYGTIFDITKTRIDKAGNKIVEGDITKQDLDIGFRTFEIVEDAKQKIYQKSLEEMSQDDLLTFTQNKTIESNEEILYNLFVAETLPLSTKHKELIKDKLYLASNVAFILGDITSDELVEALKEKKGCEYITVYSPNISNDKFTLEIESNITKLGIKPDKLRFRG
ncbi:MAG: site-specific DNA-methyltransferase [Sulfurimonas sp.]|nr:site-specific DNA-methyltransferase [Sulfurimonas sp.]